MHKTILSEGEDEETGRKKPSEVHRSKETVFRNGDSTVFISFLVVNRIGPSTRSETDKATDDECNVGQSSDTFTPAVVVLEAERNSRQEEELFGRSRRVSENKFLGGNAREDSQ